eukprot:8038814-Prorocentrum_lima.AAC.1
MPPSVLAAQAALVQQAQRASSFTLAPGLTLARWVPEPARPRLSQGACKRMKKLANLRPASQRQL